MKCMYYLSPSIKSTHGIADDMKSIGVNDWFIHIHSKDDSEVKKEQLHSSNYLETLDVIRDGLIGAVLGFLGAIVLAALTAIVQPFGGVTNWLGYVAIVFVVTCFGAWVGGLVGISSENKKIAHFDDDVEAGKYLILIYAKKNQEEGVREMMQHKHPEASLEAVDPHFLNPFADLELSPSRRADTA